MIEEVTFLAKLQAVNGGREWEWQMRILEQTPSSMNDRLPFDVLFEIFDYYADNATVYHPLETLLLVCKSWSEATVCYGHG